MKKAIYLSRKKRINNTPLPDIYVPQYSIAKVKSNVNLNVVGVQRCGIYKTGSTKSIKITPGLQAVKGIN